jgi:hypothetical protein
VAVGVADQVRRFAIAAAHLDDLAQLIRIAHVLAVNVQPVAYRRLHLSTTSAL